MSIFDAHCDVLWQLWRKRRSFTDDTELHITWKGLQAAGGRVQCFAIYIPEEVPVEQRFFVALEMVDIFYTEVLERHPHLRLVRTKAEADALLPHEIGAVLTLEGCDAIGSNLNHLRILYRLGVRSVGLTWNYSNAVADGIKEPRGAGLSAFGKQVVEQLNAYRLWTDVSHLSVRGFWDVLELADHPIASHSNCFSLCAHPRNLTDEQIRALLQQNGMIGITFVPMFLSDSRPVRIHDVLRHVEYVCSLGGAKQVGFGSDFDGIEETVVGLEQYQGYHALIEELSKQYSSEQVKDFLYGNFMRHIPF